MVAWRSPTLRYALPIGLCANALFALAVAPALATESAALTVKRVEVLDFRFDPASPVMVNQAHFDSRGAIHFNRDPVATPPVDVCPDGGTARAVLAVPRVDLWRCRDGRSLLAGIGANAAPRWVRPLERRSGQFRLTENLIGANPHMLLLGSLEGWSPLDGTTRHVAPIKEIRGEQRSVPRYRFSYPGVYRANTTDFFAYDPEGEEAGLLRVVPGSDRRERLAPVERERFAPIHVFDLQLDATGRYLLIAEEWAFRGPHWVRFAVFDIASRRRVFEERHGADGISREPHIVVGPDGHVAFAYRDDTRLSHVVVHYRLTH
jgi:hypothetical protein